MKTKKKWKYIKGLICLFVICLIAYVIWVRTNNKEIYNSATQAMVYITSCEQGGNGSIYKIESDRLVIVTTYHLLQDSEEVIVYFTDQTVAPGKVMEVNKEHDIGFVSVDVHELLPETLEGLDCVYYDEQAFNKLQIGDYMEYRYLEWNGGHVSSTSQKGSIGHLNWYIEDFDDYFIYNYCDVQPGMSGCAAVSEDGNYIGMMIGGVGNESGALSAKAIEKIYSEME